jgi:hypothetical protein
MAIQEGPMPANQKLFSVTSWLLKAASVLTVLLTALLTLVFVALVLGLAALLFAPALLEHLQIPRVADGMPMLQILAAAMFAVGGGLISIVLVLLAIRATSGIVDTAIAGDPFVAGNAERLNRIGCLLLGIVAVQFLTLITVAAIAPGGGPHVHINGGSEPDPVGLLAILLIFVLARIFQHGSQMRDELENTV